MITKTTSVSHCDRCGKVLDETTPWFTLAVQFGEDPVPFPWCDTENGSNLIDLCQSCEEDFGRWIVDIQVGKVIAEARKKATSP